MRMNLDGRRLTTEQVDSLLEACGFQMFAAMMEMKGYRLCPIRARRVYPADGRLKVCFVWKINDFTVRLSGTVDVRPA